MSSAIKNIIENFIQFHRSLSPLKRVLMYLTTSIIFIILFALSFWAGEKSYSVLFRDLTPEDSVAVSKWLQEAKIPYLAQEGGTTISVPPEFIHMARMKIMAGGLIQADVVGFEIFNKDQFGMTSFVQKLNYKRAKEGELIRTIQSLQKVKRARVHITLPQERAFSEDQKDPKASVFIELHGQARLDKEEIQAISNLVASAVEGLSPDSVAVIDSAGRMLHQPKGEGLGAQSQLLLEYKETLEKGMENQVLSILEKVVGSGYVEVRVNTVLDTSSLQIKKREVDPANVTPISIQKQESTAQGRRPNPSGVPGSRTEIPGQTAQEVPTTSQDSNKTLETINNIVPTTDIIESKVPGTIKRLTVAVILDPKALLLIKQEEQNREPAVENAPEKKKVELDPQLKAKLEGLVANAVGFDEKRGDKLQIEVMPFAPPDLGEGERHLKLIERRQIISSILQYGIPTLFLFLFFVFVVRPFIKWITNATSTVEEKQVPQTIEELEAVTATSVGALAGMENLPVLEEQIDPEKAEGEMLKEKIITMVEAAPVKAAQIIQEWLAADLQKKKKDAKG